MPDDTPFIATTPDYDSPSSLSALMESLGYSMRKKLGQNFLVDRKTREKLVATLSAEPSTTVWEIGPGLGSMTSMLLDTGVNVVAFELDKGFCGFLKALFGNRSNFTLVEGDFVRTWKKVYEEHPPNQVFGNLPYYAASAIVAAVLEGFETSPPMVFTVQKEGALRMVAKVSTKDYSSFSVLCRSACDVKRLYDIGASCFWPMPNVESSVVRFLPRSERVAAGDIKGFSRFTRVAFSSRRKTIANNLRVLGYSRSDVEKALSDLGVSASVRAEALSPEVLGKLYTSLKTSLPDPKDT